MRIHRWIVRLASWLVPGALRAEWRAEWDGEIHHRESARAEWAGHRLFRVDLIRPSMGALWDALWLQSSRWYSLRLFGRHWRMALAAIVSLSVAIAATVIGFASYNALLLRPPGVNDPGSLLLIHAQTATEPYGQVSYAEYSDYITRTHVFSEIAAFPVLDLQHRLQNRRHVARARCGDPGLEQLLPRARRHSSPGRADTQGFAVRRRRRYRSEQRVLEEAGYPIPVSSGRQFG